MDLLKKRRPVYPCHVSVQNINNDTVQGHRAHSRCQPAAVMTVCPEAGARQLVQISPSLISNEANYWQQYLYL